LRARCPFISLVIMVAPVRCPHRILIGRDGPRCRPPSKALRACSSYPRHRRQVVAEHDAQRWGRAARHCHEVSRRSMSSRWISTSLKPAMEWARPAIPLGVDRGIHRLEPAPICPCRGPPQQAHYGRVSPRAKRSSSRAACVRTYRSLSGSDKSTRFTLTPAPARPNDPD